MKNNGFTLMEILAVIIILSTLTVVSVPASQIIGEKINAKLYTSKLELAEKAAILWANDNKSCFHSENQCLEFISEVDCKVELKNIKCFNITMGTLAEQDYLTFDSKDPNIIKNPKNKNQPLNDFEITFRYNILNNNINIDLTEPDEVPLKKILLTEAILEQSNGISNILSKEAPDFSIAAPKSLLFEQATSDGQATCDGCVANNDKTIGSGYLFNESTGMFSLTDYQQNLTYNQDHIGKYTCGDNNYENCETVDQIIKITGNALTHFLYWYSIPKSQDYSDTGLYAMEDDYGTSYYYRGAKEKLNNNLIFANHQWKIVRINGNNSTKIIYNGKCPGNSCTINNNGDSTLMGITEYNLSVDDNKYIGYMFGGALNVASRNRASAVTNQTSSNIKKYLDLWYENNISGKYYENRLSDTLFCNDRQFRSEVEQYNYYFLPQGFGKYSTLYAGSYNVVEKNNPTFKCANKNDRFTVEDKTIGNGDLSYPIGLITSYETNAAGIANYLNYGNYLGVNRAWFTMTPAFYTSPLPPFYSVTSLNFNSPSGLITSGVRGVLNLNSETLVTGNGSIKNPFIVQ